MTDYQPIDIAPWLRKHASRLQSPFEQLFVCNVLAHVPGINLDSVDTQYCFTDTEGGTRYCDFVIQEGETLRIAIEIDGYDKTGRGAGMSHAEFVDWQRRHASLVAQGWDVIRFANYDVKHSAKRCIEHISLLLRSERSKNSYMESLIVREHALRAQLEQQTGAANLAQNELKKVQGLVAAATTTQGLSGSEHKRLFQLEQAQLEVANLKRDQTNENDHLGICGADHGHDVFHVPPNERASGVLTRQRCTFSVNRIITHHVSNHIYTIRRKFVGTVLQRSP
ncbi:DUF559 domain-containing protein [Pseudomonas fulva]|nr:DUF559 domain-containing protein [Pseudomonas fulva]